MKVFQDTILHQHNAFLGKTGSGKTSTAKLAIEQIVRSDPDARVCVLDPIKSDWWGLTSSADGKKAGLPFYILGGPRGHVPLHDSAGKAIGELVASGALPLSIIDMADFKPGGLQRFFNDFAPALMKRMRGVVYLVMEEAHEFAPKERSGIGAENMAIHYAKQLATAGRSKGIRIMVVTQRTQALHNALLGSCDTVFAHRMTAPADQGPVKNWLKANVSKDIFEKVSASMASLKTGSAWICSGEAQVAELVQFPKITTFDNSATPTGNEASQEIKTAHVDQDKLRAIIGSAVKVAEADDPKALRAEITKLQSTVKALEKAPAQIFDPGAETRGYERGMQEAAPIWLRRGIEAAVGQIAENVKNFDTQKFVHSELSTWKGMGALPSGSPASGKSAPAPTRAPAHAPSAPRKPLPAASGNGAYNAPQARIMASLAFWRTMGHEQPRREQVAAVAGYSPGSGNFNNLLGSLKAIGAIDYPVAGAVELRTDYDASMTADDARRMLDKIMSAPERRILQALQSIGGSGSREQIAEGSGYSAGSGNFNNLLGGLRSLCVIDYPRAGEAEITAWAKEIL